MAGQERGVSVELAAVPDYWMPGIPKLRGIKFIAYAAYLPVFLALSSSRAILHRVLSGETRIGLASKV